jgi:short-subunit dehydrogenase
MSAEEVARSGHRAFRAGKTVAICGLRNQLLTFSVRLAPRSLVRKIVQAVNASTYKS